jgi:hypothetical protein
MEGSSCHEVNVTDFTYVFYWTKVQLRNSRDKRSARSYYHWEIFYKNARCRIHHNHVLEMVLAPLGLLIRSKVHRFWKQQQERGENELIAPIVGAGQICSFHFHRNSTRSRLKSSAAIASGRMTTLQDRSLCDHLVSFSGFSSSTVK